MDEMIAQAPAEFKNNSRRQKNLMSDWSAGWYVLSEHIQDIDIEVSICLGGWSPLISSEVSQSAEEERSEA